MVLVDNELALTPIAGKSGKAYMGTYPDGGRVFVKMNTTPILAGLAREQIAPQLLWSRRLPDGNVMSGQEWLSGAILTPNDMSKKQVINILTRLHRSKPLMTQLAKLGYILETPIDLINSWLNQAPVVLRNNQYLQSIIRDLRHSNGFQTDSGLIYLVDWDSVRLTDRMLDVAHILSHYIPDTNWQEWLTYYGYKYNDKVIKKLYWFGQYSYLMQIAKYYENNDLENVNREIYALRNFRSKYGKVR